MAKQRLYNGVRFPMEAPSPDNIARLKTSTIHWIAGLLEGEGCFRCAAKSNPTPAITFVSVDFDIAIKLARLFGVSAVPRGPGKKNDQIIFQVRVYGRVAVGWMMTLYPLMGMRRRERIGEVITLWKSRPNRAKSGGVIW